MSQAASPLREGKPMSTGRLRKARTDDVAAMQRLINGFADGGLMLHRSLSELYENIRDFYVVEEDRVVVGCAALHVTWKHLAELKSLAVAESAQGRGYGRMLIQACVQDGEAVGLERIFALTYVPELFVRQGFEIVEKSLLPRKVWTECIYCPKFPDCGEIAVWIAVGDSRPGAPDPSALFPLELTPLKRPTGEMP